MKLHSIRIHSVLLALLLVGIVLLVVPNQLHHAFAATHATCASTNGTVLANCEKQDPTTQDCTNDATSAKSLPAYNQGILIGEIDLRHSDRCQGYWIRTIAYRNAVMKSSNGPVINVEANTTFGDTINESDENAHPQLVDGTLTTWTKMSYQTPPHIASGIFDLSNGTSITVTL